LQSRLDALGPWCHDLELVDGVRTRDWHDRNPDSAVAFLDPKDTSVGRFVARHFADGFEGRSVLDCGCNAGGYTFLARELGAGTCYGFDARQHWIDQARFVAELRGYEDMTFEVGDLYELDRKPADVTFFNGLFYHLPDPIRGLKIAADHTRELILVDTATRNGMPDGFLAIENESKELLLSGIYGLNWLPTGPDVVRRILEWAGFVESRELSHRYLRPGVSRLAMVASKRQGLLGADRREVAVGQAVDRIPS
jgi:tRNA (mo5U34)-methyltransferase